MARLYPDVEDSKRVLSDAKIDAGAIPFNNRANTNWFDILQIVGPQPGKVRALIEVALKDYPNDPELARALESQPPPDIGSTTVWTVRSQNPNFVGREDEMAELEKGFADPRSGSLLALTGYGGVGKSNIAAEYANRHRDRYPIAGWIKSEQEITLHSDFTRLAQELGLPERAESNQERATDGVRMWLKKHPGWLLVFDQAEDIDVASRWLPETTPSGPGGDAPCHILVTSRNAHWSEKAQAVHVPVLSPSEATDFLLKRTRQSDKASATSLAEYLGNLPLALEQAGAYITRANLSLEAYLLLFRERQAELLSRKAATGSAATIATTWDLSIQQATEEAATATEILNVCAFLAPEDIPRDLFATDIQESAVAGLIATPVVTSLGDALALNDGISALLHYSLIESSESWIEVHRLIQWVVRGRLADADRLKWVGVAVRLLAAAFPPDSREQRAWERCAQLAPHALVVAAHAHKAGVEPRVTAWLLDRVANYLQVRGQFRQAQDAFEEGLELTEQEYGGDHRLVAVAQVSIGAVRRARGDPSGARTAYEAALAIQQKSFGPNDPQVARTLGNLGLVFRELRLPDEAKRTFERALDIYTKGGVRDRRVARLSFNLGQVARSQGDDADARARYTEAVAIYEEVKASGRGTQAVNELTDIARAFQELGDLGRARELFEEALPLQEEIYGPDSQYVSHTLANLGGVLLELHDAEGALPKLERALAIQERVYGPDHPYVAETLQTLGRTYKATRDLGPAAGAFERAQRIWRDRDRADDPRLKELEGELDELKAGGADSPGDH